jgi:hypothetical protein
MTELAFSFLIFIIGMIGLIIPVLLAVISIVAVLNVVQTFKEKKDTAENLESLDVQLQDLSKIRKLLTNLEVENKYKIALQKFLVRQDVLEPRVSIPAGDHEDTETPCVTKGCG